MTSEDHAPGFEELLAAYDIPDLSTREPSSTTTATSAEENDSFNGSCTADIHNERLETEKKHADVENGPTSSSGAHF